MRGRSRSSSEGSGNACVRMCRGSIHSLSRFTVSPLPAPSTPADHDQRGEALAAARDRIARRAAPRAASAPPCETLLCRSCGRFPRIRTSSLLPQTARKQTLPRLVSREEGSSCDRGVRAEGEGPSDFQDGPASIVRSREKRSSCDGGRGGRGKDPRDLQEGARFEFAISRRTLIVRRGAWGAREGPWRIYRKGPAPRHSLLAIPRRSHYSMSGETTARTMTSSRSRLSSHQSAPFLTLQPSSLPVRTSAAAWPSVGWCPTTTTVPSPRGQPAAFRTDCGVAEVPMSRAGFVLPGERLRRFARAARGACQHHRVLRQPLLEPRRHALRLLLALGRELALFVGHAVLGVGVPPEDQVHKA